jgi:preprotein translocase subunit SecA
MDHLRASVGLKGFAQMDPKVEYKREGMRLFDQMWHNIAERTTDLIFRMESLNEDFVRSTWVAPKASHDAPKTVIEETKPRPAESSETQRAASESQKGDVKPEPIRNTGQRVGRNDPCPCGSGKKYKQCHGRN